MPSGEARTRLPWSARDDRTPRTTLDAVPTDAPPATLADVTATVDAGSPEAIATKITLTRDGRVVGAVTFVNEADGYLRIGGAFGADRDGALVRINDPDTRQSVQSGIGCGSEGNCSPDARFRADGVHYSVDRRRLPSLCARRVGRCLCSGQPPGAGHRRCRPAAADSSRRSREGAGCVRGHRRRANFLSTLAHRRDVTARAGPLAVALAIRD